MSDDLFDKDKSKDEDKPVEKPSEANKESTYLEMILNEEGKQKYSTAEEALKGAVHAQSHIANLEKELKTLRDDTDKGADMQKVLEALQNKQNGDEGKPSAEPTELNIEDVLTGMLDKRDKVQTTKDNVQTVVGVFEKLYGDKASEVLYAKADDLGFTKEEINGMVSTNPMATLKILGVNKEKPVVTDPLTDGGGHAVDLSGGKPDDQPVTIMGATNSNDLTDAWKKSKEATNKRLGGVEILS